jgi:hypothetical protein
MSKGILDLYSDYLLCSSKQTTATGLSALTDGAASAVHRYFQLWAEKGVFLEMWRRGLHRHDELQGIAWEWQSVDGSMVKAPEALESVGPNPTDRGKKWDQAACIG